ncbi:ABC transporter, ATP binding protein [mine drainage metagenome]|uniref:ABC transporter, ATP binding protein n=1 Tax=mine drainage metagenome TaxID=410659 RepID=T1AV36_9ZZZZ
MGAVSSVVTRGPEPPSDARDRVPNPGTAGALPTDSLEVNRAVIELDCIRLSYSYPAIKGSPAKPVFQNVGIKVYKNELVAIVGPTGAGKSTLLRCLGGFIRANEGHVYLHGQEVLRPSSKLVLIHQSIATFPWMTALDNVKLALTCKKIDEGEAARIAGETLDRVGLGSNKSSYPKELSGGMRQKVAIARAFAASPSILLMDEPFVHLDEISATEMRREIHSLVFNPENTLDGVVLVSHNLNEVVELADRVYVMNGSPATVVDEFRIDLPRPRAWRDSSFLLDVDHLLNDLGTPKTQS